tara:strand:+ start:2191 stop:3174 length:984 start_codon:yes stop_codon:yes gene_type:complete
MNKKIKLALVYKKNYNYFQPDHFDKTTADFFLKSFERNETLEVTYHPCEKTFDTQKLKGKCDVILLPNNRSDGAPDKLENIDEVGIPVISRTGDPHWANKYNQTQFIEENKIDLVFSSHPDSYIYKFYPKSVNHKTIIYGLEKQLYEKIIPFKERVKDKILCTGATGKTNIKSRVANAILNPKRSGWYFYKLRTLTTKLPYVDYSKIKNGKYANDDYVTYLTRYRASIAATTFYPTLKYWENAAAGCLTFMEITEKNDGTFIGFKDNESCIFINENNYQSKFQEFLSDPDNPKWEEIAQLGRDFAMNELSNDNAVEIIIESIKKLIK